MYPHSFYRNKYCFKYDSELKSIGYVSNRSFVTALKLDTTNFIGLIIILMTSSESKVSNSVVARACAWATMLVA
jgi:hypothetical protein